ncbi:MAG: hypothetical protein COA50_12770 [Flavobacteriaceae bacterium]|nr:MAG: hypothetical protein COA50_12770 [Flavobacteriaceae bacterium]
MGLNGSYCRTHCFPIDSIGLLAIHFNKKQLYIMEIIHIILGKANPNRLNGVNKVVHQLASKQVEYGRKVAVWGITKNMEHNYGKRNFKTKLFKAKRNPFLLCPELKKAIQLKKGKAVFHMHGGWIPIYFTLSKFLSKNEIPYVLTPHGAYNTVAMKRSKWVKGLYFYFFEKSLLSKARKIHFIGESEIEGLGKIFPNKKFLLLPYGFEISHAKDSIQKRPGDFIIGFVGRLDIYTKGLDLLVDSFKKFQEFEPNSKLWIVGDSDQKAELQRLIATHKLQNKVILWGSKFGNEKEELMKKMHIFVHPSRNEGLPVAVLEACELGIPSIVTKATNMGTYIQEERAGIAIEDENSKALTWAMVVLNSLRKQNRLTVISENARKMVNDVFNWKTIINRFDNLYQ